MIRISGWGGGRSARRRSRSRANHIHGAIAAIARPPSSGTTGSRLNRFRKKPVNASARHRSLPVACQMRMQAAAPMLPRIGPARPTRASAVALSPSDLAVITAPRNGMNIGALALMPSRRSCDHMSHLVHEQQHDEPGRELEAPDRRVGGDRDEHRARRREQLQLRQQQQDRLELRGERDDRGDAPPIRCAGRLALARTAVRPTARLG